MSSFGGCFGVWSSLSVLAYSWFGRVCWNFVFFYRIRADEMGIGRNRKGADGYGRSD